MLADPPATLSVLLADPPAPLSALLADPPAALSALLADPPAALSAVLADPPAAPHPGAASRNCSSSTLELAMLADPLTQSGSQTLANAPARRP
ncbi:hypothetical protein GCM10023215_25580 [Pseudonocardia yuanmonensis]|uniref:MgtE intracellular N domain-containing protein n=1 Tax=Pseudonocardia yuanmonensis TaxID=1095914 RepID=A0ABP8WF03_9PSEU